MQPNEDPHLSKKCPPPPPPKFLPQIWERIGSLHWCKTYPIFVHLSAWPTCRSLMRTNGGSHWRTSYFLHPSFVQTPPNGQMGALPWRCPKGPAYVSNTTSVGEGLSDRSRTAECAPRPNSVAQAQSRGWISIQPPVLQECQDSVANRHLGRCREYPMLILRELHVQPMTRPKWVGAHPPDPPDLEANCHPSEVWDAQTSKFGWEAHPTAANVAMAASRSDQRNPWRTFSTCFSALETPPNTMS